MRFTERTRTIIAVYVAGFISGLALIMYPAGGSLYQDPDFHDLSSGQFGSIFIVQTSMAVVASLATASVARRFGTKSASLFGQVLVVVAMLILASSQFAIGSTLAYFMILLSTGVMGLGFGMALSALNAYSYDLFPGREDAAVTAMHVIIGIGLVLGAPILSQFILGDIWWGASTAIAILMALIIAIQISLPLKLSTELSVEAEVTKGSLNMRLLVYVVLVFLYGASEATFANWSTTYLDINRGYSTSEAAVGLSVFWFCITTGRITFALLVKRLNTKLIYLVSPILVVVAFVLLPLANTLILLYLALAMGGLSLSFFFPYTISLASAENPTQTAFVSGVLVAGIQFGIGLSTVTVGALNDAEIFDLSTLLSLSGIYGVLMMLAVVYLNTSKPLSLQPDERDSLYPSETRGGVSS